VKLGQLSSSMTIREYAAIHIMATLVNQNGMGDARTAEIVAPHYAEAAAIYADALLAELEDTAAKPEEPEAGDPDYDC
jgi:hypothetical protein